MLQVKDGPFFLWRFLVEHIAKARTGEKRKPSTIFATLRELHKGMTNAWPQGDAPICHVGSDVMKR